MWKWKEVQILLPTPMTLDLPTLTRLAKEATPGERATHIDLRNPANRRVSSINRPHIAKFYGESVNDASVAIANARFFEALSPEVVLALIERLEKAEKDTARLDAQQEHGWAFKRNECGWYRMRPFTGRLEDFFPTLRAAIDFHSANPSPEASQP